MWCPKYIVDKSSTGIDPTIKYTNLLKIQVPIKKNKICVTRRTKPSLKTVCQDMKLMASLNVSVGARSYKLFVKKKKFLRGKTRSISGNSSLTNWQ